MIGSSHFSEGSEYDWEGKFDGLDGLEPSMVGGGAGGIAVEVLTGVVAWK